MAESTMTVEGTELASSAQVEPGNAAARPAGILPRISVGVLLQIQSVAKPSFYAMAAAPWGQAMVLADAGGDAGLFNLSIVG